jgi:hypothetical protein
VLNLAFGIENHGLARAIEFELDAIISLPFGRNVESDVKPVIGPGGSKGCALSGGLEGTGDGVGKGGFGLSRCGPYRETDDFRVIGAS